MMKYGLVVGMQFFVSISVSYANGVAGQQTHRISQFETEEVQVWKSIILPKQPLKMHRHENKRIVVALTDTELKVINDKGESHSLKWRKGTAHLLEADKAGELHSDLNESDHPMEVMVIQFKKGL